MDALYATQDGAEALLILNSIVLMQDCEKYYKFNIDESKISEIVLSNSHVLNRLLYLNKTK